MPATVKAPEEDRDDLRARLRGDDVPLAERIHRGPGEDLTPPRERAAREGRAPRTQAQVAAEMDPQEWACRSEEHSWPQFPPNAKRIPDGMRFSPAGGGSVLREEDCLHDCGRFRVTLLERGFITVWRRYGTRPGYRHVVVHRDEAMTKAEMREHTMDTNKTLIREAVRASKAAAKAAAQS